MKLRDKNDVVKDLNFKLKIFSDPIKIFSVDPSVEDPDGCLDMPGKINKKIDVKKCQFSTANTTLRVMNFNQKTSRWFYSKLNSVTDNIYDTRCQLIAEIDGIDKTMFTGYFRNFDNDNDETYYDFEIANLKEKLKDHYPLKFKELRKHEFVLSGRDLKEKGITTKDVAKRLLDYGFHAPTVYFPLIVEEALMIEPTECEPKEELDRFIEALIKIKVAQRFSKCNNIN